MNSKTTITREVEMSKYRISSGFVLVFLLLSFPGLAFADIVQGRVANVSSNALDLKVYDSQGRLYPNTLHLKVDNRTRLNGFSYLSTLRRQDAVSAEVRQQRTGLWRADSISRIQETGPVQQTAAPTSPSLIDALKSPTGQNMIRGGLTGAISGAVASAATSGKAGKGALIGAGVGAVGGLLADLFNRRPQSQSSPSKITSQPDTRR